MKIKYLTLLTLTTLPSMTNSEKPGSTPSGSTGLFKSLRSLSPISKLFKLKEPSSPITTPAEPASKPAAPVITFSPQDDIAYKYLIGSKVDDSIAHPTAMYKDLSHDTWIRFATRYFEGNCKSFFNPVFDPYRFQRSIQYLGMLYYGALEEMSMDELKEIAQPRLHPIFLEILARVNGSAQVLALYNWFGEKFVEISPEQYDMIYALFKGGYTHGLRSLGKAPLQAFYNRFRRNEGAAKFHKLAQNMFKNPLVSDQEITATLSKIVFERGMMHLIIVKYGIMSRRDALVKEHFPELKDANLYEVLLSVAEYLKVEKPEQIHTDLIRSCLQAFKTRKEKNAALTQAFSPVYAHLKGNSRALREFLQYTKQFEDETGRLTLNPAKDSDDDSDSEHELEQ